MPPVVVITASAGSFPGLADQLRDVGATVVERPLIRFVPPLDWDAVDAALDRCLGAEDAVRYAAVAFTSPRAARGFVDRWRARRLPDVFAGPELWAVGAGTARALAELTHGVRTPDDEVVGRKGAAVALAEALLNANVGARGPILFPCGDHRRDELPVRLREAGVVVDEVVCYRSVYADVHEAGTAVADATVVVVGSPTVAVLLAEACPVGTRPALLAAGPTTAAASEAVGWSPAVVAEQPTVAAVAAAARTLLS